MINGLNEIHESGIIHRDIKPLNIFLDSGGDPSNIKRLVVKIGDLGIARKLTKREHQKLTSKAGTYYYLSPERIAPFEDEDEEKSNSVYGLSSDMWAMGVILLEMFLGRWPFLNNGK